MYTRTLFTVLGLFISGIVGYYFGSKTTEHSLHESDPWAQVDSASSGRLLLSAMRNGNWEQLTQEEARETLASHLDASGVPAGDMVVPSQKIHSGRYIVSQWQRVAAGATVIVLGRNDNQELCIALGPQRGQLVPPQGYMEARLPTDDTAGLREKGASRINGKTGELVYADESIEDTAVREVREELGIEISKDQIRLIEIGSTDRENPIVTTVVGKYGVLLPDTPTLKTLDVEFSDDDMSNPSWVKIKDITCKNGGCYAKGISLPIDRKNIKVMQTAIRKFGTMSDHQAGVKLISFRPED